VSIVRSFVRSLSSFVAAKRFNASTLQPFFFLSTFLLLAFAVGRRVVDLVVVVGRRREAVGVVIAVVLGYHTAVGGGVGGCGGCDGNGACMHCCISRFPASH